MKKLIAISTIISIVIFTTGCKKFEDFLDKAPGVDVTEDIVFSTRQNVEAYVSTLYEYGMFSMLPGRLNTAIASNPSTGSSVTQIGTLAAATDEGKNEATFQFVNTWNNAGILPTNIIPSEDYRYYARWKAIRIANILLERIDAVTDPAADEAFKKQVKAEAKFFRALQNFELFKRYGGFPVVLKRYANSADAVEPRSTLAESVAAILKDCDEAIIDLPVSYPATQRGKATKLAVLALKSRTLLYAASPIFNTGTPYLSMADAANNKLICYGNADNNRWKLAADAAKEVLDQAALAGAALIDVPANRKPTLVNRANGNYRVSWERQDNAEIIIADKTMGATSRFGFPWQHVMPVAMGGFFGGTSVTLNFVKKYEDTLGNVVVWNDAGGNDLSEKYASLDPRFKQSIGYNLSRWDANHPIIQTFIGGTHAPGCFGGAWMAKPYAEAVGGGNVVASIPLYRLNEFYLNYAEALNEAEGPGVASTIPPDMPTSAYDAVNRIRLRSGMPNLPLGLSQSQFRERVRNERALELVFEDHRFWDIRRWLIAENDGVMKGAMYGIKITKLTATTFSYLPYSFGTRTFNKNMYLHPFDLNEVLKGKLVQNPGW